MTLRHNDTTLRHNDPDLRHNDSGLRHNDVGLRHNALPVDPVTKAEVSAVLGGSSDNESVTVDIGSGASRKIVAFISIDDAAGSFSGHGVTFDPGGAHEIVGTAIDGASAVEPVTDLHLDGFFLDIDDSVPAGSYTVQVTNGASAVNLALGAFALSGAASGQPEAVKISSATGETVINSTITTIAAGSMVCDHIVVLRNTGVLGPDDGQSQEYQINDGSTTTIGGATLSVSASGEVDTGWSWSGSSRLGQLIVSVAPAS